YDRRGDHSRGTAKVIIAPDHTQRARGEPDRPRRGVIILPNGFTLASLFFGIFAIVAASRSEFDTAGLYIVFGGLCDALDGRVARATGTGSRFGSELDSLVDAITFGLAPAMIMYFAVLNRSEERRVGKSVDFGGRGM